MISAKDSGKKSKKALFVLNNFAGGGAERNIIRYGQELAKSGYDITVVTLNGEADFEIPAEFKWKILPEIKTEHSLKLRRFRAQHLRNFIDAEGGRDAFSIRLSTLPESDKVVSLLKDDGFIYRFANDYYSQLEYERGFSPIKRKIRKLSLRRIYRKNKILCVSNGISDSARILLRRSDMRIRTIYNPFDFHAIRELAKACDPDIPKDRYIIHVGRSAEQKRHDLLIESFKQSRVDTKLILLGKVGQNVRDLVKEAALEDKVLFLDYKQNPYPLIAGAEALVLSSDREGLPGVLIEALICGTPIVSTNCKYGPSEILSGRQARFLVEPGNAKALADAINEVLANPPDLSTVDISRFDASEFAARLEKFAAE